MSLTIHGSCIDNYQGEESEIVIVTLTRSNASRDIGFMGAPERLNVLLSRARDALIMIGNAETFLNARKGKDIWVRFFDLLRRGETSTTDFQSSARDTRKEYPPYNEPKTLKRNVQMGDAKSHGKRN